MNDCKRNYKVLHVFSGFGGGISSLILNLIENKTGEFEFDTIAFSYKDGKSFIDRVAQHNAKCYEMPRPRVDGIKSFFHYVNTVIKRNKYDAVHCHISGWMSIPFYFAAKKNGINTFVIHAHTTRYDNRIDRIKPIYLFNQWCNYHISNAYMTCSDLASKYIFGTKYIKKRPAALIPNGIKKELFLDILTSDEYKMYRNIFSIDDDTTVLMHVGRFSPPKNHDFILEIARKLKNNGFHFKLLLVGDGELFDLVSKKIIDRGLDSHIKMIGRRKDISKLMQFADCMLLPSLNEGLPTVAVECQAAGTPMLLSDTITRQCDMGLGLLSFVSLSDTSSWVNKIYRICCRKGKKADYLSILEDNGFTATSAGEKYCLLMKKLIDGNGAGEEL